MKVKELQKTVNIAWSPLQQNPICIAAGTAAQQFDSSANSALEIYETNFSDPSYDLELKCSLASQYRFQKLIWSPTGSDAAHGKGLIVGGCEGGHVMIYSASKMLANEEGLIARQDKHTGPVTGLDFNPFQTNLLASCASESEIFIWDLNNPTTHMNPGAKTQPLEDVQNVAFNRQVQHILASVFSTRCVIWDLRKTEQIIKLSDTQSRVRWHAIQWHPEVATQVWLASEDDQAPVVQLWDLRYATAPAKTMQIHQRGVLGMSWCPRDSDLMVSCGKDNRIYCWNPNTELPEGEILSEVATTGSWYSAVHWCPRNPALIASSSFDGNVSIYSLFGGTQQQVQTANKIADSFPGMDQFAQAPLPQQSTQIVYHDLKRAPKWIKKPCGVAFGFGGKLVYFNGQSKNVTVSQVVTEPALVERANALESSLADANFAEYCRQRADQTIDQNGRYLWYFIKANFELNPKEELLNLLGYNKDDIDSKFAKYIKEDALKQEQNDVDQLTNRISNLTHQPLDNNALFEDIAAVQKQRDQVDSQQKAPVSQFKIPSGEHPDSLVAEALLTGNLEAAVELCLESERTAEALIIASTAGIDFLTSIQNRFLQAQENELSRVISALVSRDWLDFVSSCTVDSWKEALVAALKHSDRKLVDICERLGDRLLSERASSVEYTRNAMLCYICAGSIDKLVTAWYQLKQLEGQKANYKLNNTELQELAEVVMLMSKSLEQQGIALELSGRYAAFAAEYGGILAAQGALSAALAYIFALGPSEHAELDDLRERIYKTVNYKKAPNAPLAQGGYKQQQAKQQQQQQQQPSNVYSRQQQHRGSFSQPQTFAGVAAPLPNQNQYQTNAWNAPPPNVPATIPATAPNLYNPLVPTGAAALHSNDTLNQPPRPLSTASSQGGSNTTGSGVLSRSKYVLDPSVAASGPTGYGNIATPLYNPQPAAPISASSAYNSNTFNPHPYGAGNMPQQQPTMPVYNTSATSVPYTGANNYMPVGPPIETAGPPPPMNVQRNPTPPPGWNDPPALKSARASKKIEASGPITHPLFGVDPNQNQNGYMDPNAHYQNTGMPPPPLTGSILNPTQNTGLPPMNAGVATGGGVGGYLNPAPITQNNNTTATPQFNFQTAAIPTQQQQQQQQWQTQSQNIGYTEQPAPVLERKPEIPKEKPPLPEEYIYLQTVLEELKNQCLKSASDPRTKRKFVDVVKRLENLYDCLRDDRLNATTIAALNQIIQFIQIGDYGNALQVHTQVAFGSDFSQCAGFMPGLKVLVQSAADLQVYLQ